jgi:hypothetical protein
MAEYLRQPGDVIQAGFALNAGKVISTLHLSP